MKYTDFAISYGLTPREAVAIPALFEKAGKEVGLTPKELATAAMFNRELGEYLAQLCRQVIDMAEVA